MIKNRKQIRLKQYDYTQSGYYFITICTQNRECLFGDIVDKKMKLNNAGNMINMQWNELLNRFHHIQLDKYVIMPNHIHGIIVIKSNIVGVSFMKPFSCIKPEIKMAISKSNHHMGLINQTPTMGLNVTLGLIIRYFKSKCSYEMHKNGFNNNVWQRNYYEHIIRNEKELFAIRRYIEENPL